MKKENSERLVKIFVDLISIDAVSGNEKPVADYISSFLGYYDIDIVEDCAGKASGGNSGNLIATIPGDGEHSQVALMAHMDTIQSTWGVKPVITNEIIKSNGNTILGADNRAGIAIILYVVEQIKENSFKLPPFEVIFTIGEETGLYGSMHLELNRVKSKTIFILDSSASPGAYVLTAPYALEFEIDLIGQSSHAAVNPDNGVNAIKMAAEFVQRTRLGQIDDSTTINIGKILGGEANNLIPSKTNLTGEIRSLSKEIIQQQVLMLEKSLENIVAEYGGHFNISTAEAFPGYCLSEDSKMIQNLYKSMIKVGLEPLPLNYKGGSDANILNNRGLQAVNLGIGAKNPHSYDEYIKVADMTVMVNLVYHLLKN
jgi:tripeptide aminopeptidase